MSSSYVVPWQRVEHAGAVDGDAGRHRRQWAHYGDARPARSAQRPGGLIEPLVGVEGALGDAVPRVRRWPARGGGQQPVAERPVNQCPRHQIGEAVDVVGIEGRRRVVEHLRQRAAV